MTFEFQSRNVKYEKSSMTILKETYLIYGRIINDAIKSLIFEDILKVPKLSLHNSTTIT